MDPRDEKHGAPQAGITTHEPHDFPCGPKTEETPCNPGGRLDNRCDRGHHQESAFRDDDDGAETASIPVAR